MQCCLESEGESCSVTDSLWPHGLYIHSPWNSPGQNTGVGRLFLLQGIFLSQGWEGKSSEIKPIGSNPGLPRCKWILYQLSHKGSPRILEWVAYPFSSGSSRPRNQTGVSCIAGGFFTNWAIRETWRLSKNLCLYKSFICTNNIIFLNSEMLVRYFRNYW